MPGPIEGAAAPEHEEAATEEAIFNANLRRKGGRKQKKDSVGPTKLVAANQTFIRRPFQAVERVGCSHTTLPPHHKTTPRIKQGSKQASNQASKQASTLV
jgi:hypothetical protein